MNRKTARVPNSAPRRQTGAILVVGLIMLFIMALIGVRSLDKAIVANQLAVNNQFQNFALNDAETVIASAEQAIDGVVSDGAIQDFDATGDAYYLAGTIDPSVRDWTFDKATTTRGDYVVEYAGYQPAMGESVAKAGGELLPGSGSYLFRVTTRSSSGKDALRILQTVYRTQTAP